MKIIDVPIYNEDGSVQFTQSVTPVEAQALLQFAINFLAATGLSANAMRVPSEESPQELND